MQEGTSLILYKPVQLQHRLQTVYSSLGKTLAKPLRKHVGLEWIACQCCKGFCVTKLLRFSEGFFLELI